jgi:hypothetical protein
MRDQIGWYRLRLQSKSASAALLSLLICALSLAPVTFALDGADSWSQQIDSNGTITLTDGTILIQGSDNAAFGSPTSNTVTGLTTASSLLARPFRLTGRFGQLTPHTTIGRRCFLRECG